MQIFYTENPKEEITLGYDESRHAKKVLRKQVGDTIQLTDGKGNLYTTKILFFENRQCKLRLIKRIEKNKQHNYYLHVAISPTKNMQRFEWFLEKSTEIGIDEITPIICDNSERKIIKHSRGRRIIIAALKQSLKYHLPKLNEAISLNEFIQKNFNVNKYIAHCKNSSKTELKKIKKSEKNLILIGPEGDFSNNEIKLAVKNNFCPISLGNCRLRTETAGILAAHTININN